MPAVGRYALSLVMAAGATLAAFICRYAVHEPSLALVYVVPVAVAAAIFGWGEAFVAAVAGALAFDFFFVPPYFSLWIASPSDLWALLLLLIVAAIVSTVAAEARRNAFRATESADRADALQRLAHAVIYSSETGAVVRLAAEALARAFKAPAVVLLEQDGRLGIGALGGGAALSAADEEAARGALSSDVPTQAETYPFPQASFDFWPIAAAGHPRFVLGVSFSAKAEGRPETPITLIELVAGYLAVALAPQRTAGPKQGRSA